MSRLRRAIRKPPKVIAFRAVQALRLGVMQHFKTWPRLERSISRWWSDVRVHHYAVLQKTQPVIIAPDAPAALRTATQHQWINHHSLFEFGRRLRDRKFELLGAHVPSYGGFPWHSDWRWNYVWKPAYFRSYDFYSRHREVPYDVKVPWELSRMGFVLPILQNAALDPEGDWIEPAAAIVADWERQNPLAYTVNWSPMEAAMRGINLLLALEMLLVLGESRARVLAPVLRLITTHGTFVWRTLEYTDVRGNHYTAQLIALLLFGLALHEWYPESRRWLDYALKTIPSEITLQFFPDGVNFEKSVPYHRLVTELFLLGVIALERASLAIEPAAKERLRAACGYTAAYTRPDGLSPNVGDNDDARVFGFDPVPLRDHRALVGVAAAVFDDADLHAAVGSMSASLAWFLGLKGLQARDRPGATRKACTRYFSEGGVVVTRAGDNFLWVDVGEVGLTGRGGHGHNDLLSFELMLQGIPVVVDPGSFVYTGDPTARDLFRSTAYHNGLRLDSTELAPMAGMWTIGNHAVPHDVEVQTVGVMVTVRASHAGYRRLPDPVLHTREIKFNVQEGALFCTDYLECTGRHEAERFLHLDPLVEVSTKGHQAHLSVGAQSWVVQWEETTEARIDTGWVSPDYGVRQTSKILVLTDIVEGGARLSFAIRPLGS
jgi:hypothetical protein